MKKVLLIFSFTFCILHSTLSQTPGEWTWMSGDNFPNGGGVFGTQGVPSVNNYPQAMYEGAEWTDHAGNFWIYGGQDFGSGIVYYSDLWKYNPSTNEWTWVRGPGGATGIPAVYGTQGVSSPANYPGDRGWGPAT